MNEKLETERKSEVKAVASFVLVLAILGLTVMGVILLVINKRGAKEEEKGRIAPAVEVAEVAIGEYRVVIATQGVVESVRETMLAAEVGGRVMEVAESLRKGGTVEKGSRLVQIDPADYRSALAAAEVRRTEAELALEQERAKVEQAKLDWDKLGNGKPINLLVLRKPYLEAAEAKAASATEEAARARRDVERTEILAPFDAGVRSVNVEIGAVVAPGTMVAELYASNDLEVRLPLSLEDFGFLARDGSGAVQAEVVLKGKIGNEEYSWSAEVARVDPEIERKTLSATVVVRVMRTEGTDFPLPPVGLFVNATVTGKMLGGVAEIPRRALLEGNRVITVGEDGNIEFRNVEVLRLTEGTAVVHDGIEAGDRIVLTRLSAPVVGMNVTIEADSETGGK